MSMFSTSMFSNLLKLILFSVLFFISFTMSEFRPYPKNTRAKLLSIVIHILKSWHESWATPILEKRGNALAKSSAGVPIINLSYIILILLIIIHINPLPTPIWLFFMVFSCRIFHLGQKSGKALIKIPFFINIKIIHVSFV